MSSGKRSRPCASFPRSAYSITAASVLNMFLNVLRRSSRRLPKAEGPYIPGCTDIMTGYSQGGCLLRLYYPTSLPHNVDHSSKWFSWMPSNEYLDGFAYVMGLWRFLFRLVYYLLAGDAKVTAAWGADVNTKLKKLPVIILSHGLGASRFLYSCVCNELASHGYLVAVIEHRENSAGATWYYESQKDRDEDKRTWIKFKHIPLGKDHYAERNKQIKKRASECVKAVDLLERINAGSNVENILKNGFLLTQLKDRLDLSNLVMMGHSFGGGTALLALGTDSRFRLGIILDGWMFALKEEIDLPKKVTQPVIFINTQTFQIPANVSVMQRFIEERPTQNTERAGYTIKATTHESQSDTPFLLGYWLNLTMKKINALTAIRVNNHLILDFLQRHIGVPEENRSQEYLKTQSHHIAKALAII
ncbi:platelet-activating factor acetylhydrolase-like [Schistocerca gregaria]|uniref:platelet-activating factor acetylhydrolase-like n=1 Tax=Schistocerca gregaria TaxID=7010 RepID=UPI00211EA35D|nr:platelet-activating factor acetylhydrolase-like [Schistocerca gregaria]